MNWLFRIFFSSFVLCKLSLFSQKAKQAFIAKASFSIILESQMMWIMCIPRAVGMMKMPGPMLQANMYMPLEQPDLCSVFVVAFDTDVIYSVCSGSDASFHVVVNGHVFKVRVNEEISGESLYFPGEESRPVRKHKFDAKSGSAMSATSLKSRRFSIENQLCFTHHNEQRERESNLIGNLTGGKGVGDGLPQASTPKTLLGDVDLLGTRDLQDEIDRESIGKKQKAADRAAIDREESSSEQGTAASNSGGGELQPTSKSAEVLMASTQERDDEGVQLGGEKTGGAEDFFNQECGWTSARRGTSAEYTDILGRPPKSSNLAQKPNNEPFRDDPTCSSPSNSLRPISGDGSKPVKGQGSRVYTYSRKK
ncbi:hypothetical protein Ancab_030390 [Ancistrocladus abbreviatus]